MSPELQRRGWRRYAPLLPRVVRVRRHPRYSATTLALVWLRPVLRRRVTVHATGAKRWQYLKGDYVGWN